MSKIREAVETLEGWLNQLAPHGDFEPVPPEGGRLFKTLNNSIVYVLRLKDDPALDGVDPDVLTGLDFMRAVVLVGGHKISASSGEHAGETYHLDREGYYYCSSPCPELVLSLKEVLPVNIEQYL
ncbi:MAG TPA: hypothetical protein PKJ99_13900 [Thermoanaerobaculales bacterium]|nr:hypothetical protein [Thermoanaerobaculales bacterium]